METLKNYRRIYFAEKGKRESVIHVFHIFEIDVKNDDLVAVN